MPHRPHLYRVMLLSLCWVLSSFALAQQPQTTQQPSPASQNPASPEQATPGTESKANAATENATSNKKPAPETPAIHNDVVIKGGTILTVTHGKIENGSIYVHNGKIAAVGQSVNVPAARTGVMSFCPSRTSRSCAPRSVSTPVIRWPSTLRS